MSQNVLIVDGVAWDSPYPGFFHAGIIAYPVMGQEGQWQIVTENHTESRPTFGTQFRAMQASRDLKARDVEQMRQKVAEYDQEVLKYKGPSDEKLSG